MNIQSIQTFPISFRTNTAQKNVKPTQLNTLTSDTVSFGARNRNKKQQTQELTPEEKQALIMERKKARFKFKQWVKEERIKRIEAQKHNIEYVSPFAQPKQKTILPQTQRDLVNQENPHTVKKPKHNKTIKNQIVESAPSEKLRHEHEKARLKKIIATDSLREAITHKLISDKKLEVIINKIKEYPDLMEELFFEPAGGVVMLEVSDEIMKNVLRYTANFEKLLFTKDDKGLTFIEKAPTSKVIILNEAIKKDAKSLEKLYTEKGKFGKIPAHYLPPEALASMNEVLANNPKLIEQIYLTQDKHGNTPAHNRFYESYKVISQVLTNRPQLAARISRLKNNYGETYDNAILKAQQYQGPYDATWNFILKNC